MTRDEAIALVLARCVRTGDTNLSTAAQTEMQYVIRQVLERRSTLPWFLIPGWISLTTTASDPVVAVPTDYNSESGRDFIREYEDGALWILQSDGEKYVQLQKDAYDALYNSYGSELAADEEQPTHYALVGDNFYLFPTPDAAYTLRGRFYIRDTAIDANIENNWLREAADLVIAETGLILAGQYLHDDMLYGRFMEAKTNADQRLWRAHEAREHAAREYEMGDD